MNEPREVKAAFVPLLFGSSSKDYPLRNVWIMKTDGSDKKPISHLNGKPLKNAESGAPVWSPDGNSVLYNSNRVSDPNQDKLDVI